MLPLLKTYSLPYLFLFSLFLGEKAFADPFGESPNLACNFVSFCNNLSSQIFLR